MKNKICSMKDCCFKVVAKNLCMKHYQRFRRHGSPYTIKKTRELEGKCEVCGSKPCEVRRIYLCEKDKNIFKNKPENILTANK